uniref:Unconventional myosin-XVIIIa n=1 Tax=Lygus hesperus TaxID=30085 RepID=A0A0A9XC98_LYGHE
MKMDVLIAVSCMAASSYAAETSSVVEDGGSWVWKWLSFMLSRSSVYVTLVAIILFNFAATFFKNKFLKTSHLNLDGENDRKHWSMHSGQPKWNPHDSKLGIHGTNCTPSDDDTESIKERLREAEVTMAAIKAELEQTKKTNLSLENSLEELERDRSNSEEVLIKMKMAGSLELENLRKENASYERQLERAKDEINSLTRKMEVLQREARISESALSDQQNLMDRLETTRAEMEAIKTQLKGIKIERDTAVRLASEQIYKMTPDERPIDTGSMHRRELIEEMIDMELKRMREEVEANERNQEQLLSRAESYMETTLNSGVEGDVDAGCTSYDPSSPIIHRNALGDAPPVYNCPDDTFSPTTHITTETALTAT